MHLSRTLCDQLMKTVVYFKNRNFGIKKITSYELGKHACPDLSHVKVVRSRACVHILNKKRVKLDVYSCQELFIGYESTHQY